MQGVCRAASVTENEEKKRFFCKGLRKTYPMCYHGGHHRGGRYSYAGTGRDAMKRVKGETTKQVKRQGARERQQRKSNDPGKYPIKTL